MFAFFLALTIATTFCVNTEKRFILDPEKQAWIKKPLEIVVPADLGLVHSSRIKKVEVEKQTSGCNVEAIDLPKVDLKTNETFELASGSYRLELPTNFRECNDWWYLAFNVSLSASEPFLVRACSERYFVRVFPETDIKATEYKAKFEECGQASLIVSVSLSTSLKVKF